MSSTQNVEPTSAAIRFEQAFDRLKDGNPTLMPHGTPVSQNNVAREAGLDPSALKKARFPTLVRKIQAYIELHKPDEKESHRKAAVRAVKRTQDARLADTISQRDMAQSLLGSANFRIIELTSEVNSLQLRLDELLPPPRKFGER